MGATAYLVATAALAITAAIPSCGGGEPQLEGELEVDFEPNYVPLKFTYYPATGRLSVAVSSPKWVTPIGTVSAGVVVKPSSDEHRVVQVHVGDNVYAIEADTSGADIVIDSACSGVQTVSVNQAATTIVTLASRTKPCRFIAYTTSPGFRDPLMLGRYQVAQCEGYLAQVGSVNADSDDARDAVDSLLERFPEAEYQSNDLCLAMTAGRYSVGVWTATSDEACVVQDRLLNVALAANPDLPENQWPTVRDLASDRWLYALCGAAL
jgi:hypothetical protein